MGLYVKREPEVVAAFRLGVDNQPVWFVDAQARRRAIEDAAGFWIDGEWVQDGEWVLYWEDMDRFGSLTEAEFVATYEPSPSPESGRWPGGG